MNYKNDWFNMFEVNKNIFSPIRLGFMNWPPFQFN